MKVNPELRRPTNDRSCSWRHVLRTAAPTFGTLALWAGAVCAGPPPRESISSAPTAGARAGARAVTSAISSLLARNADPIISERHLDAQLLRSVYEPHHAAPLWTDDRRALERGIAAVSVLAAADREGLDPATYGVSAIKKRLDSTRPTELAELDLLLTDAVARYGSDVSLGRSTIARRNPDIAIPPRALDRRKLVLAAAAAPDTGRYLADLAPDTPEYTGLRAMLVRYRSLAEQGGWQPVPARLKLEPGMSDPGVPALRQRLLATGDLPPGQRPPPREANPVHAATDASQAADGGGARSAAPVDAHVVNVTAAPSNPDEVYDDALVAAVRAFQSRHGLDPDGRIGPRTRAALNVSATQRMAQIALNMERARWWPRQRARRHVLVNIPGFSLQLFEDGKQVFATPVVVGQPSWRTPILSSKVTDLIFNPPWKVPDRIAQKELLPRSRRDRSYFTRQGIEIEEVPIYVAADTASADHSMAPVPVAVAHRLRQAPGPKNLLGRVKFHFSNRFGVYMHDTPSKGAMDRPARALSHGCVRVGNALALAGQLLQDDPARSAEVNQLLSGWNTRAIPLRRPVPVDLIYQTAWLGDDGKAHFAQDLYSYDSDLAEELSLGRWAGRIAAERPRTDIDRGLRASLSPQTGDRGP
jgi:murein L,D-transpeptidase YcbB/YkuD